MKVLIVTGDAGWNGAEAQLVLDALKAKGCVVTVANRVPPSSERDDDVLIKLGDDEFRLPDAQVCAAPAALPFYRKFERRKRWR